MKPINRLPESVAWTLVPVFAIGGIAAAWCLVWLVFNVPHLRRAPGYVHLPFFWAVLATWLSIRLGCWIARRHRIMIAIVIATACLTAFVVAMAIAHAAGWMMTEGWGWFWRFVQCLAVAFSALDAFVREQERERSEMARSALVNFDGGQ